MTKQRRQTKRKQDWKNKRIHGQFIRDTKDITDIQSWNWLWSGHLKRETESLITSNQDQCIRTNKTKTKIDGTRNDRKCRMCKVNNETMTCIISECPKLLQKEHKRQHDWMGKTVHWDICRKKGFNVPKKWQEQKPLPCTENESFKILWDFHIQTENIIEHRRTDMIIIYKTSKEAQIVKVAVPADQRIEISQQRKIANYQDLKRELQKFVEL